MAISNEDIRAIEDAVETLHYVSTDANGSKYIEIYADYRDTNEGLLDKAYENRKLGFADDDNAPYALVDFLRETIGEWYADTVWDMEDKILRKAGLDDVSDDRREDCLDYLREQFPIIPDYDHFLGQDTRVNIMLKCGDEGNRDFIGIREQFAAMFAEDWSEEEREAAMAEENGLSWLVRQQGHTMEELTETIHAYYAFFESREAADMSYEDKYKAFRDSHNPFLTSVCQELANMVNDMNTMTALVSISLDDLAEFMQPGKELVLPKNAMIGIFNPWNGGGSTLDIELEKDLVVPSDLLYDIQIEGVKPDWSYTVDGVYGLIGSAWVPAKQVREQQPEKNEQHPTLDNLISAAQKKAGAERAVAEHDQQKNVSEQERG